MEKSGKPKKHVLRPLFWWLILVLVLYGIRTHQRLMEITRLNFNVTLQGHPIDSNTTFDGKPAFSGQKIPLGNHTFTVTHPKGETFSTDMFIWYGEHDLGTIDLKRTMGTLSVTANPPAPYIFIRGPEWSVTLTNSSGLTTSVPTDQYTVESRYTRWDRTDNVTVFAGSTAFWPIAPRFGAVQLSCNQSDATFQLLTLDDRQEEASGFPDLITELPEGNYKLISQHHGHQREQTLAVKAGVTNDNPVEFSYGAADLETTPAGASVQDVDGRQWGVTPLNLPELLPGTLQLTLRLGGYEPVPLSLEITANQTATFQTNLISTRYTGGMKSARAFMADSDYSRALQAVDEALNAKPGDADALALQAEASGPVNAEREREEQLKRPLEVFNLICSQNSNARLFDGHELKTSKPAKEVEAAIVKSLQASPRGFQILDDETPQPETYQVMAQQTFSLGILGGTERDCLLVVGQAKDDETQIFFKVLEFQVQHSLVNFRDVKELIPLHSSRIQMNDMLQSQIQEGIRNVTERIQSAIGQ